MLLSEQEQCTSHGIEDSETLRWINCHAEQNKSCPLKRTAGSLYWPLGLIVSTKVCLQQHVQRRLGPSQKTQTWRLHRHAVLHCDGGRISKWRHDGLRAMLSAVWSGTESISAHFILFPVGFEFRLCSMPVSELLPDFKRLSLHNSAELQ